MSFSRGYQNEPSTNERRSGFASNSISNRPRTTSGYVHTPRSISSHCHRTYGVRLPNTCQTKPVPHYLSRHSSVAQTKAEAQRLQEQQKQSGLCKDLSPCCPECKPDVEDPSKYRISKRRRAPARPKNHYQPPDYQTFKNLSYNIEKLNSYIANILSETNAKKKLLLGKKSKGKVYKAKEKCRNDCVSEGCKIKCNDCKAKRANVGKKTLKECTRPRSSNSFSFVPAAGASKHSGCITYSTFISQSSTSQLDKKEKSLSLKLAKPQIENKNAGNNSKVCRGSNTSSKVGRPKTSLSRNIHFSSEEVKYSNSNFSSGSNPPRSSLTVQPSSANVVSSSSPSLTSRCKPAKSNSNVEKTPCRYTEDHAAVPKTTPKVTRTTLVSATSIPSTPILTPSPHVFYSLSNSDLASEKKSRPNTAMIPKLSQSLAIYKTYKPKTTPSPSVKGAQYRTKATPKKLSVKREKPSSKAKYIYGNGASKSTSKSEPVVSRKVNTKVESFNHVNKARQKPAKSKTEKEKQDIPVCTQTTQRVNYPEKFITETIGETESTVNGSLSDYSEESTVPSIGNLIDRFRCEATVSESCYAHLLSLKGRTPDRLVFRHELVSNKNTSCSEEVEKASSVPTRSKCQSVRPFDRSLPLMNENNVIFNLLH